MTSMQWWRCKHGAPFDPKWGVIAKLARTEPGKVWAVVTALYDRASQAQNRGDVAGAGLDEIAEGFGWPVEEVQRIYSGLKTKSVIIDNRIASWEKHQPKRERPKDNSTERTRRYRERLKASSQVASHAVTEGVTVTPDVTPDVTVRDGHVTVVTVVTESAPSQAPAKPQLTAINGGLCDATVTPRDAQRREDSYLLSSSPKNQNLVDSLLVRAEPEPTVKPASKPISSKRDRGTRWPAEQPVPDDWLAKAAANWATRGLPVDLIPIEAEKFVAHWTAKAGKDAAKVNWSAAWRTWYLNAYGVKANGRSRQHGARGSIFDHALGPFGGLGDELAAGGEIPADGRTIDHGPVAH